MTDRYRETVSLGQTLANEPQAFPGVAMKILRRWARRVWNVRGGGFYACGFVIAFVVFEIQMFIDDIINFEGFESIGKEILQYVFRFALESLGNTIQAFAWPVYIMQLSPIWGGLFLGLGFWLFPLYLKKHIEDWLFQDDDSDGADATADDPKEETGDSE